MAAIGGQFDHRQVECCRNPIAKRSPMTLAASKLGRFKQAISRSRRGAVR
jgi:hypothetical protein